MTEMVKSSKFDHRWLGVSIPAEHWHFHRRLFERYALVLGPGDYSAIKKDIRKGTAILVRKSGHRGIYLVQLRSTGDDIYVAVSGTRLATVCPPAFLIRKQKVRGLRLGIFELPEGTQTRVAFRKINR